MTDIKMEDMPDRIAEFFNDQEILITGTTGFIGKVLVEKLMRIVPKFGKIYAIIRPRKGKSSQQRLDDIFKSPLFDIVRKEKDFAALHKSVIAINGDVALPDLGLSDEDRKMLSERVNIVYHAAATVRFDELLKTTVFLNTRGTKVMLDLAKEMKRLKLFVYVSTAYSQIKQKVVEEKIYPSPADPEKIIKCMESMPDDIIEAMTLKILGNHPNSYSFTKALAEDLVAQARAHIPAIIARPSIVIPIWRDPLPGWSDNLNGPVGLLIAAGKGVIRTMYCSQDGYADVIPVDLVVNSLLSITWYYLCVDNSTPVFNITNSEQLKMTWSDVIWLGKQEILKLPLEQTIWIPGGVVTGSHLYHHICVIFFHLLPAFFLDTIIYCAGYKPVMFRVHCRINKGFKIFDYYTNKIWAFDNSNTTILRSKLNAREDKKYFFRVEEINKRDYFRKSIEGGKVFILKESLDKVPTLRRVINIMYVVDVTVKILFFLFLIYLVASWTETGRSLLTNTWSSGTKALPI